MRKWILWVIFAAPGFGCSESTEALGTLDGGGTDLSTSADGGLVDADPKLEDGGLVEEDGGLLPVELEPFLEEPLEDYGFLYRFSPSGNRLFYGVTQSEDRLSGALRAVDLDRRTVREIADSIVIFSNQQRVVSTPQGDFVVFRRRPEDAVGTEWLWTSPLWMYQWTTGELERLADATFTSAYGLSPGGEWLLFASSEDRVVRARALFGARSWSGGPILVPDLNPFETFAEAFPFMNEPSRLITQDQRRLDPKAASSVAVRNVEDGALAFAALEGSDGTSRPQIEGGRLFYRHLDPAELRYHHQSSGALEGSCCSDASRFSVDPSGRFVAFRRLDRNFSDDRPLSPIFLHQTEQDTTWAFEASTEPADFLFAPDHRLLYKAETALRMVDLNDPSLPPRQLGSNIVGRILSDLNHSRFHLDQEADLLIFFDRTCGHEGAGMHVFRWSDVSPLEPPTGAEFCDLPWAAPDSSSFILASIEDRSEPHRRTLWRWVLGQAPKKLELSEGAAIYRTSPDGWWAAAIVQVAPQVSMPMVFDGRRGRMLELSGDGLPLLDVAIHNRALSVITKPSSQSPGSLLLYALP